MPPEKQMSPTRCCGEMLLTSPQKVKPRRKHHSIAPIPEGEAEDPYSYRRVGKARPVVSAPPSAQGLNAKESGDLNCSQPTCVCLSSLTHLTFTENGREQMKMAAPKDYVLQNRFLDLTLLVGLDDNTPLGPPNGDLEDSISAEDGLNRIFHQEHEPQVLYSVTANRALYFQPYLNEDRLYPPHNHPSFKPHRHTIRALPSTEGHFGGGRGGLSRFSRSTSVSPAMVHIHLRHSKPLLHGTPMSAPELPLSEEVIQAITHFCFPDYAHISQEPQESSVHFLVLTDLNACKTFAACLTFYRPYLVQMEPTRDRSRFRRHSISKRRNSQNSEGHVYAELKMGEETGEGRQASDGVQCYFPQCCVLISQYPYFSTMKDCLSCLMSLIEKDPEEMFTFIKEMTYTLCLAPVPPPGKLAVEVQVFGMPLQLCPPDRADRYPVDVPLHMVFRCLATQDVVRVIGAMLLEQKIVFLSSNYALLTVVMETFMVLLEPFRWRFTYVPILSSSSLELLEAPGTFMMGCHSKHGDHVLTIDGLMVVRLDEGVVTFNADPDPNGLREIPSMPQESARYFCNSVTGLRVRLETEEVKRPTFMDFKDERFYQKKKIQEFNVDVCRASLLLMVNLFRDVLPYVKQDIRKFSQQLFLDNLPMCDRPFYEMVCSTDMFRVFLDDRMDRKEDHWTEMEMKTRPAARRRSGLVEGSNFATRRLSRPLVKQPSSTVLPLLLEGKAREETFLFKFPTLNLASTYIHTSIHELTKAINDAEQFDLKSSYLYLRGMFQAADGNAAAALTDLIGLQNRDVPTKFIRNLWQACTEAQREKIRCKAGFHQLTQVLEADAEQHPKRRRIIDHAPVPSEKLYLDDFVDAVAMTEIVIEYEATVNLFHALMKSEKEQYVEPETYELFLDMYRENESQCESIPPCSKYLSDNEFPLRVSSLIKTDYGTGRLVLTDKRLFFLKDVSQRYREVVKLKDINKLEKIQLNSLFSVVDALLIHSRDGSVKFSASLKHDRNCWHMLIEEMRAGKVFSTETKDTTATTDAITNVLLVDAVYRCYASNRNTAGMEALQQLCTFTLAVANKEHQLPKATKDALQQKVDPSQGDRNRHTVEALLYTPGFQPSSMVSHEMHHPPRLWCAMGDGTITVFDMNHWIKETSLSTQKQKVACLADLGYKVWAGSYGVVIIDIESLKVEKELNSHHDLVMSITLSRDHRFAYTASVDACINKYNTQTLTVVKHRNIEEARNLLHVQLQENLLYCGTWKEVTVLNEDLEKVAVYKYSTPSSPSTPPTMMDLDCFAIFPTEVWAGCRRECRLVIWDRATAKVKQTMDLPKHERKGVSVMLRRDQKLWVGMKSGVIFVIDVEQRRLVTELLGHKDAVRAVCCASNRYIVTGAGSKDGKVALWSPSAEEPLLTSSGTHEDHFGSH